MVNINCKRLVDEGEDYRDLTYAKFGREIMNQPRRIAIQIFDQQIVSMLRDEYRIKQVTKAESNTIAGLAEQLELDPVELEKTISEYNAACGPEPYNPRCWTARRRAASLRPNRTGLCRSTTRLTSPM
jgi:tricarballylate dehydrogenase